MFPIAYGGGCKGYEGREGCRPANSYDLVSKSHGQSENLEIAKQFRWYETILKNLCCSRCVLML